MPVLFYEFEARLHYSIYFSRKYIDLMMSSWHRIVYPVVEEIYRHQLSPLTPHIERFLENGISSLVYIAVIAILCRIHRILLLVLSFPMACILYPFLRMLFMFLELKVLRMGFNSVHILVALPVYLVIRIYLSSIHTLSIIIHHLSFGRLGVRSNEEFIDDNGSVLMTQGTQDAMNYLDGVKKRFEDEPIVYKEFISLMTEVAANKTQSSGAISKIKVLFRGHEDLLRGLDEYIETSADCN